MRVLVFHQFLWAHYKAKIYSELEKLIVSHSGNQFHVAHISLSENSRLIFGEPDYSIHQYAYSLLFEKSLDDTTIPGRFKAAIQKIKEFKPDVINIPGYNDPAMWMLMLYAKLKGVKVILSNDSTERDNPNVFWKEAIKSLMVRASDGFFCFGKHSADYIQKLGGKEINIFSRRNSVDNERITNAFLEARSKPDFEITRSKYGKYNFIFVGRFIPFKNLSRLIEAFQKLAKADDWGLLLMGGGEEEDMLRQKATMHPQIAFLPASDWLGVAHNLALADVFVLPSISEPWGLVVNEAMTCALPIIVSRQSGCEIDLVQNGRNGFSFDARNVDELCEKMQYFVNNPEKLSEFGNVSAEIIKNYTPEKVAEEMYLGYQQVIKNADK